MLNATDSEASQLATTWESTGPSDGRRSGRGARGGEMREAIVLGQQVHASPSRSIRATSLRSGISSSSIRPLGPLPGASARRCVGIRTRVRGIRSPRRPHPAGIESDVHQARRSGAGRHDHDHRRTRVPRWHPREGPLRTSLRRQSCLYVPQSDHDSWRGLLRHGRQSGRIGRLAILGSSASSVDHRKGRAVAR